MTSRSISAAIPPLSASGLARRSAPANRHMLWIPPGFAHGFMVLSEGADVLYKATDFYAPQHERTIYGMTRLADSMAAPSRSHPLRKDLAGQTLEHAAVYEQLAQPEHQTNTQAVIR